MRSANTVRQFWSVRQPRERRVLILGAVLLLPLLVWLLLIAPAIEGRSRWQQALPKLRSQLAHMRAIASEIAALPASPTSAPAADLSRASLERSLKGKGLEAQNLTVSDNGVTVNFSNVSFTALTEWLQQTQSTERLVVNEATITARDLPGRVDARLNLQRTQ